MQTYLCASRYLSPFAASETDLATLALVVNPFWKTKGAALWALARGRMRNGAVCKPYEAFVLDSMGVDDAAKQIAEISTFTDVRPKDEVQGGDEDGEERREADAACSPLGVLAGHMVREHVRKQAEEAFLQCVLGGTKEDAKGLANGDCQETDVEMRRIVAAGRSLDEPTVALVDVFEKVCNPAWSHLAHSIASDDRNGKDADILALLHATVLYRRIFPSTLLHLPSTGDSGRPSDSASSSSISISLIPMLSPPPSPSRKNAAMHLSLRRALDSAAFDGGDALEDARDRVVDMLTSSETAGWLHRSAF